MKEDITNKISGFPSLWSKGSEVVGISTSLMDNFSEKSEDNSSIRLGDILNEGELDAIINLLVDDNKYEEANSLFKEYFRRYEKKEQRKPVSWKAIDELFTGAFSFIFQTQTEEIINPYLTSIFETYEIPEKSKEYIYITNFFNNLHAPRDTQEFQALLNLNHPDISKEQLKEMLYYSPSYLWIDQLIPSLATLYQKKFNKLPQHLEEYFNWVKRGYLEQRKQRYPNIKIQIHFNKNYYLGKENVKHLFRDFFIEDLMDWIRNDVKEIIIDDIVEEVLQEDDKEETELPFLYVIYVFFYIRSLFTFSNLQQPLSITNHTLIDSHTRAVLNKMGVDVYEEKTANDLLQKIFIDKVCEQINNDIHVAKEEWIKKHEKDRPPQNDNPPKQSPYKTKLSFDFSSISTPRITHKKVLRQITNDDKEFFKVLWEWYNKNEGIIDQNLLEEHFSDSEELERVITILKEAKIGVKKINNRVKKINNEDFDFIEEVSKISHILRKGGFDEAYELFRSICITHLRKDIPEDDLKTEFVAVFSKALWKIDEDIFTTDLLQISEEKKSFLKEQFTRICFPKSFEEFKQKVAIFTARNEYNLEKTLYKYPDFVGISNIISTASKLYPDHKGEEKTEGSTERERLIEKVQNHFTTKKQELQKENPDVKIKIDFQNDIFCSNKVIEEYTKKYIISGLLSQISEEIEEIVEKEKSNQRLLISMEIKDRLLLYFDKIYDFLQLDDKEKRELINDTYITSIDEILKNKVIKWHTNNLKKKGDVSCTKRKEKQDGAINLKEKPRQQRSFIPLQSVIKLEYHPEILSHISKGNDELLSDLGQSYNKTREDGSNGKIDSYVLAKYYSNIDPVIQQLESAGIPVVNEREKTTNNTKTNIKETLNPESTTSQSTPEQKEATSNPFKDFIQQLKEKEQSPEELATKLYELCEKVWIVTYNGNRDVIKNFTDYILQKQKIIKIFGEKINKVNLRGDKLSTSKGIIENLKNGYCKIELWSYHRMLLYRGEGTTKYIVGKGILTHDEYEKLVYRSLVEFQNLPDFLKKS